MDISAFKILQNAIKEIPALKWALGVAGVASVVAIVAGFQLDIRIAVFGTMLVIGLMFVLVVFSAIATHTKSSELRPVALFAAWSFMVLLVTSSFLLMTSYFFSYPRPLESYLPKPPEPPSVELSMEILNSTSHYNPSTFIISGDSSLRLIPNEILSFRLSTTKRPNSFSYDCLQCNNKESLASGNFVYEAQSFPGLAVIDMHVIDDEGVIIEKRKVTVSIEQATR
jgi:hypothetical protein